MLTANVVPEPSTLTLLALGVVGLVVVRRRATANGRRRRSPAWPPSMNPAAVANCPPPRSQSARFESDGRLFGIRFAVQVGAKGTAQFTGGYTTLFRERIKIPTIVSSVRCKGIALILLPPGDPSIDIAIRWTYGNITFKQTAARDTVASSSARRSAKVLSKKSG